ncbi:MAG: isopentenyl phosphate kinase [Candidatus Hermodarchaeota archaeon]
MTVEDVLIIKLGGSLLTDKSIPYRLKEEKIEEIAAELKECIDLELIKNLVIIHGVGSFGHPPVLKYNLHKGFQGKDQLIHLSETQQIVNKLRRTIVSKFFAEGIPVNLMHASSMVVGDKMKIVENIFDSLKGFLSLGMVPLIGGDIMYDKSMGFSICSGDLLAVTLSQQLNPRYLIFATDVPGVFDKDPKLGKDAKLIKEINISQIDTLLNELSSSSQSDASGRMKGKLQSISLIKDEIYQGLDVAILSMSERGNLKKYLKGEEIPLTKIISN